MKIRNKTFQRPINIHFPVLYDRFFFLVTSAVLHLISMSLLNSCKFAV